MTDHGYYTPTDSFIERHGLHIDEQEMWCDLNDTEDYEQVREWITFNKHDGQIILRRRAGRQSMREADTLFCGYLPNEEALESVIEWTGWGK